MREQQHVADRRLVGEQHHQAVDADAETRGRRQAILERTHVVGVVEHRFLVARALARHLLAEARSLVVRVVQLGEAVGELAATHEELEAVGDERIGVVAARERRHLGRVGADERGLHQARLGRLLEDLDLQLAGTVAHAGLDAELLAHAAQVLDVAQARTVDARVEVDDEVLDRDAAERLAEIVHLALVRHLARAEQRVGEPLEQALDQVHQITVVGVRLVQLEHRELGVVARRQPLVTEVAVQLEHALEAAHHQALQVQLGRDAQVHVHVERVVVRDERLRHGAAGDHLHHRRLDLHEAERLEEVAQVLHDARALAEHLAALVAHDQVDIALPVALLDVREAMPLVGQRPQRLDQQPHALGLDGELAGLGLEERALGAEDVAHVPALEGVVGVAERLLLQEHLDGTAVVLQLGEARLAHDALGHHATGDRDLHRVRLEPLGGVPAVREVQVFRDRVAPEVVRERDALLAHAFELRAPLRDEVVLVAGRRSGGARRVLFDV